MPANNSFPHDHSPEVETPQEKEIVRSLRQFQPRPSDRFYRLIAQTPWQIGEPEPWPHPYPWARLQKSRRRFSWAFAALLALVLLLTLLLISPPVNATAKRFAQFFMRKDQDQIPIRVTSTGVQYSEYDFSLSIEQAGDQSGFTIRTPAWLPDQIHLNGAAYNPQLLTVVLDFKTAGSNQILRITQRRAERSENFMWIGASAEVESVMIAGNPGEYVVGAWKLPEMAPPLESAAPGMTLTLDAQWDPQARVQILRWQTEGMFYEILSLGSTTPKPTDLDKQSLIALAESMR